MRALTAPRRSLEERNALVAQWLRLVPFVLRKMHRKWDGLGEYADDVQDGYLGLVRAAELFDPDLGVKFATYAARAIWSSVAKARNRRGVVARPANWRFLPEGDARRDLAERAGHVWRIGETPAGAGRDDAGTCLDRLDAREVVAVGLAALTPRERTVIEERFIKNRTLRQVGEVLGVSYELVRKIEKKALERMRRALHATDAN